MKKILLLVFVLLLTSCAEDVEEENLKTDTGMSYRYVHLKDGTRCVHFEDRAGGHIYTAYGGWSCNWGQHSSANMLPLQVFILFFSAAVCSVMVTSTIFVCKWIMVQWQSLES